MDTTDEPQDDQLVLVREVAFALAEGLATTRLSGEDDVDVEVGTYLVMRVDGKPNSTSAGNDELVRTDMVLSPRLAAEIQLSLASLGAAAWGESYRDYVVELMMADARGQRRGG